jgi:predicted nucleic acid-binding protein
LKILKSIEKLAVDANPILSAIIGGNARSIFLATENTLFYTAFFNYKEVEKYIPVLASKRNIPIEDLYLALSMLPLSLCDVDFYKSKIRQAELMIGKRDPHDVHLLALSMKLNCPIWSNDKDFEGIGVKVYSTLDLMKGL